MRMRRQQKRNSPPTVSDCLSCKSIELIADLRFAACSKSCPRITPRTFFQVLEVRNYTYQCLLGRSLDFHWTFHKLNIYCKKRKKQFCLVENVYVCMSILCVLHSHDLPGYTVSLPSATRRIPFCGLQYSGCLYMCG